MSRLRAALLIGALLGLVVVAGSALVWGVGVVASPAAERPPPVLSLSKSAAAALRAEPLVLARDAAVRRAEMITLRIRNISCGTGETGSAFAIDPHTLITNRHVIAGAAVLEANTWDGTTIDADVSNADTGELVDIGIVQVNATLPAVAKTGPEPPIGAPVQAVGYPLGGPLTISPGKILGYVDGNTLPIGAAFDGQVIEISSEIRHGNSGGPLLDRQGRVVGVVFAAKFPPNATEETASEIGYAIPVNEIGQLLQAGGEQAVIPCGL